jgi:hypothetical protein
MAEGMEGSNYEERKTLWTSSSDNSLPPQSLHNAYLLVHWYIQRNILLIHYITVHDIKINVNFTSLLSDTLMLTLSHMAYGVLFTIWQGGQPAIPLRTTLAKVKTILGADYTLAMLCSIMCEPCCQTLIGNN